jgi:hypothetical protein
VRLSLGMPSCQYKSLTHKTVGLVDKDSLMSVHMLSGALGSGKVCTSRVTLCDNELRLEAVGEAVLHPTVTICMHKNQDRARGLSDFMLEGPSMMSPSLMFV